MEPRCVRLMHQGMVELLRKKGRAFLVDVLGELASSVASQGDDGQVGAQLERVMQLAQERHKLRLQQSRRAEKARVWGRDKLQGDRLLDADEVLKAQARYAARRRIRTARQRAGKARQQRRQLEVALPQPRAKVEAARRKEAAWAEKVERRLKEYQGSLPAGLRDPHQGQGCRERDWADLQWLAEQAQQAREDVEEVRKKKHRLEEASCAEQVAQRQQVGKAAEGESRQQGEKSRREEISLPRPRPRIKPVALMSAEERRMGEEAWSQGRRKKVQKNLVQIQKEEKVKAAEGEIRQEEKSRREMVVLPPSKEARVEDAEKGRRDRQGEARPRHKEDEVLQQAKEARQRELTSLQEKLPSSNEDVNVRAAQIKEAEEALKAARKAAARKKKRERRKNRRKGQVVQVAQVCEAGEASAGGVDRVPLTEGLTDAPAFKRACLLLGEMLEHAAAQLPEVHRFKEHVDWQGQFECSICGRINTDCLKCIDHFGAGDGVGGEQVWGPFCVDCHRIEWMGEAECMVSEVMPEAKAGLIEVFEQALGEKTRLVLGELQEAGMRAVEEARCAALSEGSEAPAIPRPPEDPAQVQPAQVQWQGSYCEHGCFKKFCRKGCKSYDGESE